MDKRTKLNRIGETNRAKNGMMMTIIAYRRNDDIDVQFEDGYIATGRAYDMFKQGRIGNPNVSRAYWKRNRDIKSFRVGETNRAKNGQMMTIVVYRRSDDIDILFEDGYLAEHKQYIAFLAGEVRNPNAIVKGPAVKTGRVGETHTNTQGLKLTIIAYRKADDLDAQFENGAVVTHVTYYSVCKGNILCPNLPRHFNRVGESALMHNGQVAKIVAYRSATDIDVQFEDDTVVVHQTYKHFQLRQIRNPNLNPADKYIGMTGTSSNGFLMKITDYRNAHDIDVVYNTGYIKTHTHLQLFKNGQIGHPLPYALGTISIDKPAYIHNGIGNFYCHCVKCGNTDILTIDEILHHVCKEE